MSCDIGDASCETPRRRAGLAILGILAIIFIVLSLFSFMRSRGQVTPDTISFGHYQAADGKRVFQAYDCMGCHTMVGNGAYLAPDLTEEYRHVGPAWLAAFLPSAGSWPTEIAVRIQLQSPEQMSDSGTTTIDAYLKKFPGALSRLQRRGGTHSFMPNLPITSDEVGQLIAYLKYTSAMNTEGWPPEVEVEGLDHRLQLAHGSAAAMAPTLLPTKAVPTDPVAHGAELVKQFGCTACHSANGNRLVGPGWGGVHGSEVTLADGKTVVADDAYLKDSIREPNEAIVASFPPGIMPNYGALLKESEINDIVAYLNTLEK